MSIEYLDHEVIGKHFFKPKSVQELKGTATVVIDTNVLLSAYQWKEVTLLEVKETLEKLESIYRLKIPSHVVKEFMDQRPKRIVENIKKIETDLLSKFNKLPKLSSIVPFLEMLPQSDEYLEAEKEYNEAFNKYKKSIQEITDHVKEFINSDPVLDNFEQLIINCYYQLEPEEIAEMEKEIKDRVKYKIPPLSGGDSQKKENYDGDFIIWKHILKLNTDVIFVTSDSKEDWVIKDHHNKVLSPRRELIEEFYMKTNGKTFAILSPKDFVELFNVQLDSEVADDLNKTLVSRSKIFEKISDIFINYDPAKLNAMSSYDAYDIEASYFISFLPDTLLYRNIEDLLYKTIKTFHSPDVVDKLDRLAIKAMTMEITHYLQQETGFYTPQGHKIFN